MKIDRSKVNKNLSEMPLDCQHLIQKLKECNDSELMTVLKDINTWYFGKCELYHWVDVLDRFDEILSSVTKPIDGAEWMILYDKLEEIEGQDKGGKKRELVKQVLRFTALLMEFTLARHLYNSMEHLITLLMASDMEVVLSSLGVLYVFSKRSNFIPKLPQEKRKNLQQRLTHIAESWGGKDNGFGLAECCKGTGIQDFPESANNLHFEFYSEKKTDKESPQTEPVSTNTITTIHMESIDKFSEGPGEMLEELIKVYKIPKEKQVKLFNQIRLAKSFSCYEKKLQCIQARLQAVSILVYSNTSQDVINTLLYSGFIEEVVEVLEITDSKINDIKSCALRTLTAILHLERNPRVNTIIEATGAASYHGFLPSLVRTCIQTMTDPPKEEKFPQPLATALFSFLYHLASYEAGGEALVTSGLMESMLKVIEHPGREEHITCVTRVVRTVDLVTNIEMTVFQNHEGLTAVIKRLQSEITVCKPHHAGILTQDIPKQTSTSSSGAQSGAEAMETSPERSDSEQAGSSMESVSSDVAMETETTLPMESSRSNEQTSMEVDDTNQSEPMSQSGASSSSVSMESCPLYMSQYMVPPKNQCLPQRAALIKSLLGFLKKAISDPAFNDTIRTIMDGSLPNSLKYIISNVEYYGPVLFNSATEIVTVYVFHEPSLLSSLQDNGLTGVVLKSLVVKDVPATRDVLASLPNVLSALCLNARGLQAFMDCQPFDKLFRVLLSPDYLPAMKRRKGSDALGDTASNLGMAMDELMRHQPTLKFDAMVAIIKLLEELGTMGRDSRYIAFKTSGKTEAQESAARGNTTTDEPVSDEDEDDEDQLGIPSTPTAKSAPRVLQELEENKNIEKRTFIPLMDYILNVVKFVDAILSNNSTDDHCREFVNQSGLAPLMGILNLPNLPLDFPSSPSCQAVSSVCKAILMLSHEPQVLTEGLKQMSQVLQSLTPLHKHLDNPSSSILIHEIVSAPKPYQAIASPQHTPLLHSLASVQAFINMFVHVCRVGQSDIRNLSVNNWGSEQGLPVLEQLSRLYSALVWENNLLLMLISQDSYDDCEFACKDVEYLATQAPPQSSTTDTEKDEITITIQDVDVASSSTTKDSSKEESDKAKVLPHIRLLKQLSAVLTKLTRSLVELFSLLVKLSIISGQRQRRNQPTSQPSLPSLPARMLAAQLSKILAHGLSWGSDKFVPSSKLRLSFYVSILGCVSHLLFDERKVPNHLMLQQFVLTGAHSHLFELFKWVVSHGGKMPADEGVEHPDLPDGSSEFIDTWLSLVEKLSNPKSVLESQHSLPATSTVPRFVPFKPLEFVISTQKGAFASLMYLWNRKPLKSHGAHISETTLSILANILQGEVIIGKIGSITETTESNQASTPSASTAVAAAAVAAAPTPTAPPARAQPPLQPEVNELHLQQLMDMGFTREHARDALLNTSSLERATEYILTHPPPVAQAARVSRVQNMDLGFDMELSEEDQMMRAIAMSLGENDPMSVDQPENPVEPKKEEDTNKPLEKEVIDNFTSGMLPGCLRLLADLPDTVFRLCDLLVSVSKRNGKEWRDGILRDILQQICDDVEVLKTKCNPSNNKDKYTEEYAIKLSSLPEAAQLSSLLHLYCLLLQELKYPCAVAMDTLDTTTSLTSLLEIGQQCLSKLKASVPNPSTPKWMSPLLLLIDQYEKNRESLARKRLHDKCTTRKWKWFDDRSGRWYPYSDNNNQSIDTAFRAGESSVRFVASRRPYTVNFNTMVQVNVNTGNRRPVMLEAVSPVKKQSAEAAKSTEKEVASAGETTAKSSETSAKVSESTIKTSETLSSTPSKASDVSAKPAEGSTEKSDEEKMKEEELQLQIAGLNSDQMSSLVRICTGLLSVPVDPNTLHAVLRLCLRLTREYQYASLFIEHGGLRLLLSLTDQSAFPGYLSLISMVVRHVLEDSGTLAHTLEKIVRSAAVNGIGSTTSGVGNNSVGTKEIHYIMRVLSPAACRNPGLFQSTVLKVLKYAQPAGIRSGGPDGLQYIIPPNQPHFVKTVPVSKPVKLHPSPEPMKHVVYDLLDALCSSYCSGVLQKTGSVVNLSDSQTLGELGRMLGEAGDMIEGGGQQRQRPVYQRLLTGEHILDDEEDMLVDSQSGGSQDTDKDTQNDETKIKAPQVKPLLTKADILRMLTEMVKSYAGVAQLVAEYIYHAPQTSPSKQTEGPVLAYILDNLLPQSQSTDETPPLARLLLAMMAACNHSPDAQTILVNELKSALARALALPESPQKHSKLQSLFSLILTIIESGPQQSSQHNNAVKLLVKKGLIIDLARVTHSLDLSSPNMAPTVNAMLKPLEKLSNIVNQPATVGQGKPEDKAQSERTEGEATILAPGQNEQTRNQAETIEGVIEGVVGATSRQGDLDPASQDSQIDESVVSTIDQGDDHVGGADESWDLSVAGHAIVHSPQNAREQQEEDVRNLQEMVEELLEAGANDSGNPEDGILGEHILSRRIIDSAASFMMDQQLQASDSDSDIAGSDGEHQGDADEPDDTMVITFEGGPDEDDDDDDDDDDCDDDDDDDDEDDEDDDVDDDEEDDVGHEGDTEEDMQEARRETNQGDGDQVVEVEEEEEDEDDQDDDEDEDEEEEGSDLEGAANLMLDGDDTFQVYDEDDPFLSLDDDGDFGQFENHSAALFSGAPIITSNAPSHSHTAAGTSETATDSTPALPGVLTTRHPLLIRQPTLETVSQAGQRVSRVRGLRVERGHHRHHGHQTHTIHVHYPQEGWSTGHASPPTILQRILEAERLVDDPHMNAAVYIRTGGHQTRLFVGDDIRIITRGNEDALDEEFFLDAFGDGTPGSSNPLASIPTALSRWTEESQILDGNSVHFCIAGLKPEVLPVLEQRLESDLETQKEEERKKKKEAEEKTKTEDAKKKTATAADVQTVGGTSSSEVAEPMQVEVASTEGAETSAAEESVSVEEPSSVQADATVDPSGIPIGIVRLLPEMSIEGFPFDSQQVSSSPEMSVESSQNEPPSGMFDAMQSELSGSTPESGARSGNSENAQPTPESGQPVFLPSTLASALELALSSAVTGVTQSVDDSVSQVDVLSTPSDAATLVSVIPGAPQRPRTGVCTAGVSTAGASTVTPDVVRTVPSTDVTPVSVGLEQSAEAAEAELGVEVEPLIDDAIEAKLPEPSTDIEPSSTPQSVDTPGPSGARRPLEIDGIPIPEGVDPSFLEALPESIRREVLAEQLGLRPPPPSAVVASEGGESSAINVSPEFLAALPPEVQQEVLQQQRIEQERQRIRQQPPDVPVDPASFISSLPPSLRQTVLADIDDSLLPVLPPDLATEAQSLRREMEARHHRLLQERFAFNQSGEAASAISSLLRHTGLSRRVGSSGLHFSRLFPGSTGWGASNRQGGANAASSNASRKINGRQLLDHEALTCLLLLLFVDEPRLNTTRLHKVLRNLCHHNETRAWIIRSLISVLRRTSNLNFDGSCQTSQTCSAATSSSNVCTDEERGEPAVVSSETTSSLLGGLREHLEHFQRNAPEQQKTSSWLSIGIDAAIGCRASIFIIQRGGKSGSEKGNSRITIHPQAVPFVCRHVLDCLAFIAKHFPVSFTPFSAKVQPSCSESKYEVDKNTGSDSKETPVIPVNYDNEMWEILVKLDSAGPGRKGKGAARTILSQAANLETNENFGMSPVGLLMSLLSHPVIKRNTTLTDRLLGLLSLISMSLPELPADAGSSSATTSSLTGEAIVAEPSQRGDAFSAPLQPPAPESEVGTLSPLVERSEHHIETESVTSSLVVERSPVHEPESEAPDLESLDGRSVGESITMSEPMDVEVLSNPSAHTNADQVQLLIDDKPIVSHDDEESRQSEIVAEEQLQLAVDVLTSGACSEDGLEDATTLLLQISRVNSDTRDAVLSLLLQGSRDIGNTLCQHIAVLIDELKVYNKTHPKPEGSAAKKQGPLTVAIMPSPSRRPRRRPENVPGFGPPMQVAQRQTKNLNVACELHLPAMTSLTNKMSSQSLFLRILKVILQLREAARKATKAASNKTRQRRVGTTQRDGSSGLGEAVAALEAEANAIMVALSQAQSQVQTHSQSISENEDLVERALESRASELTGSTGSSGSAAGAMDIESTNQTDQPSATPSTSQADQVGEEPEVVVPELPKLPRLSIQLSLDHLWDVLGSCLTELANTGDNHAVLVLQPAVESFFLVHGTEKEEGDQPKQRVSRQFSRTSELEMPVSPGPLSPDPFSPSRERSVASLTSGLPPDTQKFLEFAETHRIVLNQILRQTPTHLADGPFAVLVDHTRVLDFDVKRRYFRQELERMDEGMRREDLTIHLRREHVFEDSFRELHRRTPEEMKSRLYVVFEGEEGQDAGGLLREWYAIISREMFNPNYALFTTSPGDRVTYQPNASSQCNSNHLSYFKFVGRVVAKAIYDNKLLECYFTRSFYKHILGKPVHFTDMESFDYSFYQGLVYLMEHDINDLGMELTFSTEIQEFGLTEVREMIPNGRNIPVTEENKKEYMKLVCQTKMTSAIRKQIDSFLEGFYDIIPKRLISIFNEQEMELLISGLPNIDLDDLKANTEYHKYNENSLQIQWFWRALRSLEQEDLAKFLQFVTGTSKVPLQGFAALEGMNGSQKFQIHRDDRSTDRLPSAHTCFNQLDLPAYETYDKLRSQLVKAIQECPEGFGLA